MTLVSFQCPCRLDPNRSQPRLGHSSLAVSVGLESGLKRIVKHWGQGLGTGTALICRVSFSLCGSHCRSLKVKLLLQAWGRTDQNILLTVSLGFFISLVNPLLCEACYWMLFSEVHKLSLSAPCQIPTLRLALWPECVQRPSHHTPG